MKKRLIIISFFFCGIAGAQIYTPVNPTTYGHVENRSKSIIVQHIPEKDSTRIGTIDTTAQIFYNQMDSSVWAYSKAKGFFRIGSTTSVSTDFWSILGNTGTNSTNKIGTKSNSSLRFITNDQEHMKIDSLGYLFIGNTTGASISPLNDISQIQISSTKTNNGGAYILLNSATPTAFSDSGSINLTDGNYIGVSPLNPLIRLRWANGGTIVDNMVLNKHGQLILDSAVGVTGTDNSVMLDVRSLKRGFLAPRMTGAQMNAIVSPATGLLVYVYDSVSYCYYTGAAWLKVTGAGGVGTSDGNNFVNSITYLPNGILTLGRSGTSSISYHLQDSLNLRYDTLGNPTVMHYTDVGTVTNKNLTSGTNTFPTNLNTINGLTPTTDNVIQSVSSAWASRTTSQLMLTLPVFTTSLKGVVPSGGAVGKQLQGDGTWVKDSTGVGQVIDEYASNHPIFIDSAAGSYQPKPFRYSVVSGIPHFKFPVIIWSTGLSAVLSAGGDSTTITSSGGSGGTTSKSITIGVGLDAITPSGNVRTTWNGDSAITLTNEFATGVTGTAVLTGSTDAGGSLTIRSTSNATPGNINIGTSGAFHNGASNYISGLSHMFAGTSTFGSSSTTTQPSYRRLNNTTSYTPHIWVGDNSFDNGDARIIIDATYKRIGFAVGNDTGRIYSAGIEAVTDTNSSHLGRGTSLSFLTRFGGDSARQVMKLDSLGAMWLPIGYGAGTQTGTAAYDLSISSTGKVIVSTVGGGGGGVGNVKTDSVQTLTHKRILPRTVSYTSNNVPTFQADTTDLINITALTVAIDSIVVTGTPVIGETLTFMIKGTATRAITWGSAFAASSITLPTTTNGTARIKIKFICVSPTGIGRYEILGVS